MYLLLPLMNYWYGMVPVRYHGMVPWYRGTSIYTYVVVVVVCFV